MSAAPDVCRRLCRDERGLSTAEYIVLLVLMVATSVVFWSRFGESILCRVGFSTGAFEGSAASEHQCGQAAAREPAAAWTAPTASLPPRASPASEGPGSASLAATPPGLGAIAVVPPPHSSAPGVPRPCTHEPGAQAPSPGTDGAASSSETLASDSSSRSFGTRVVDAIANTGKRALDFGEGVVAGLAPFTPLLPERPKPTFGHEVEFGIGEAVGSIGGLVYDSSQIAAGTGGVLLSAAAIAETGGVAAPVALPAMAASGAQIAAGGASAAGHIGNFKEGINYAVHGSDPVPAPLPDAPSRSSWTSTKKTSASENASDHYRRHGSDFGARTEAEYIEQAHDFLHAPPEGTLTRTRANGDVVRYDPKTEMFGVMDKNGTPRTLYRPDPSVHGRASNLDYFNAQ